MTYKIKQLPEDFIVEETLPFELEKDGAYSYFLLEKRNMTTEQAVQRIADLFRVERKFLSYAGTKDKQAVTKQYIAAPQKYEDRLRNVDSRTSDGTSFRASFVGRYDERLNLGSNKGNRFTIVVRNLSPNSRYAKPSKRVPNYFDEQRFSTENVGIGKLLLKKKFKEAVELIIKNDMQFGKKIQAHLDEKKNDFVGALRLIPKKTLLMYVHSYQSMLFNHAVAVYIRKHSKKTWKVTYSQGEFVFTDEKMKIMKVPLVGFSSELKGDIGKMISARLEKDGLTLRDFIIRQVEGLTLEGELREMFFSPQYFKISGLEDDDLNFGKKKMTVSFELRKGNYATIIIKSIFHKA